MIDHSASTEKISFAIGKLTIQDLTPSPCSTDYTHSRGGAADIIFLWKNHQNCQTGMSNNPSRRPKPSPLVLKFVTHSKRVLKIATRLGWLPGARYTNLRDVRNFDQVGFLDIDWRDYNFSRHLKATKATRPHLTVARDLEHIDHLEEVLDQARLLAEFANQVIVVPKDISFRGCLDELIPENFLLGFSVPTRYGKTNLAPENFGKREVHLLGGRPDTQRGLAKVMNVVSLDCNRFTLDASFGDYFDGETFRPHPIGGYERCVKDSLKNINLLWNSYDQLEARNG